MLPLITPSAVVPHAAVANAFAIMGIVMAIFAVLACDFYGKRDFYNFGTFTRAYFSMFQVVAPPFIQPAHTPTESTCLRNQDHYEG